MKLKIVRWVNLYHETWLDDQIFETKTMADEGQHEKSHRIGRKAHKIVLEVLE